MASKAMRADMAIMHSNIIIVDREFSIKEALAIKDGKIMAVGRDDELKGLIGPKIEVLDLRGKTVLPGINDFPLHGASLGGTRSSLGLD